MTKYNVYYMDNDRQKKYVAWNLSYHQIRKIRNIWGTDLYREMIA